MRTLTTS